MDDAKIVFFGSNRVWRLYRGGKLLDEFLGEFPGEDGSFPEDWLASATRAVNGVNQQSPDEGLSVIIGGGEDAGKTFADYLRGDPRATLGVDEYSEAEGAGVLCKFLDSAIRLPLQCHPDREFARKHYNSNYGKAEAWIILDTREIDGEKPYLLMGFKPGVTRQAFKAAVEKQDIPAMENMMHRVEVRPGDMFFIPGRLPHAIGPGVFLLEVQEPTDWVVQPEKFLGDVELSDTDMWGPLTPEVGLECFDYESTLDLHETLRRVGLCPAELRRNKGGVLSRILGADRTGCFEIRRLDLTGEFTLAGGGYVGIVTKGRAEMIDSDGRVYKVEKGGSFFVPDCAGGVDYIAKEPAEVFTARNVTLK